MAASGGKPQGRGSKRIGRVAIEDRILRAEVPAGSRFKGYESFLIQDLVLRPVAIRFRRERWVTLDGRTVVAPLPPGIDGHFGPELRRFVLAHYHQGQVTVPRLVTLLGAIGIEVSKRQVVRLLIGRQDRFLGEARDVLRAGLAGAACVTVDDTGARHKATNGFCTQIGNDHFAWFGTTGSKSRLNFLELLRTGHGDYVINAEALAYMRARALAGPLIRRLAEHDDKRFADRAAWQAHLERLGITALEVLPDPVQIATVVRQAHHEGRPLGQRQGSRGYAPITEFSAHRHRLRRRQPGPQLDIAGSERRDLHDGLRHTASLVCRDRPGAFNLAMMIIGFCLVGLRLRRETIEAVQGAGVELSPRMAVARG